MNTVPKYCRTFHWPSSPGVQNDDKMYQYPDMMVGVPVIITEKIDGGCTCLNDGKVYARSTGQEATQSWFAFVKKYHAWKSIAVPFYFYGEDAAAKHSIEYTMSEDDTYRIFAIRNMNDMFEAWDNVENLSQHYQFKTVPVLFKGTFNSIKEIDKWFETEITKSSEFGPEREGFVMR